MLYIGHFSFTGTGQAGSDDPVHGSFTCLVEARSIKSAVQKLRTLLKSLKRGWEGFGSVRRVYLDNCAEVKRLPRAACWRTSRNGMARRSPASRLLCPAYRSAPAPPTCGRASRVTPMTRRQGTLRRWSHSFRSGGRWDIRTRNVMWAEAAELQRASAVRLLNTGLLQLSQVEVT